MRYGLRAPQSGNGNGEAQTAAPETLASLTDSKVGRYLKVVVEDHSGASHQAG